ncbi:unnamed protein product, partial [Ectocarpus sp. 4 AP-2014]
IVCYYTSARSSYSGDNRKKQQRGARLFCHNPNRACAVAACSGRSSRKPTTTRTQAYINRGQYSHPTDDGLLCTYTKRNTKKKGYSDTQSQQRQQQQQQQQ